MAKGGQKGAPKKSAPARPADPSPTPEPAAEQSLAGGFASLAVEEFKRWKRPFRALILLAVGLGIACYYVWNSLPESTKKDVLASLQQNRDPAAQRNNNSPPNEAAVNANNSAATPVQATATPQPPTDPGTRQSAPPSNPPSNPAPSNPTRPAPGGDVAARPARTPAAERGEPSGGSRDEALIQKVIAARGYAKGNAYARDTAAKYYYEVGRALPPASRARLDAALLRAAEADYRAGRLDEALHKYTALFANFGGDRQE
jgi:hypothetical protein